MSHLQNRGPYFRSFTESQGPYQGPIGTLPCIKAQNTANRALTRPDIPLRPFKGNPERSPLWEPEACRCPKSPNTEYFASTIGTVSMVLGRYPLFGYLDGPLGIDYLSTLSYLPLPRILWSLFGGTQNLTVVVGGCW